MRVEASAIDPYLFGAESATELVFVNGRVDESLSLSGTVAATLPTLPAGVNVTTLSTLIASGTVAELEPYLGRIADFGRTAFSALNTALSRTRPSCSSRPASSSRRR